MDLPRPPQKGLARFRFRRVEDELKAARVSVRRWWWEYLRLSKDYWLVSQTYGRTMDRDLYDLWRKFGDVHNTSFDDWWVKTGSRIFREQTEPPKVLLIDKDLSNLRRDGDDRVLIEVPLVLRKETVQRQLRKILASIDFDRPRNVLETSTSEFPINPVAFRLQVLAKMHEVWCAHRNLVVRPAIAQDNDGAVKREYERADLFELGKRLNLSPANAQMIDNYDEWKRRQNRMRATVSRYLRRANMLIYNVERGRFPMFKPIHKKGTLRFNERQRKSHVELEKQWWEMDLRAQITELS